ncbi:2-amino-4-hydroxy-6-hydroxymethyldihydropteridine diphosphokinase [Sediminitomix flava]|uniref:2-amino-4-hydroxy-6-hydroxymethyldihydropteridine pyrophosphokinase n=1 Tax=Sediminitomix flava TaxID=379075 RepID=A0A315Z5R6_SEDFL|nr:2-amino-4-hydroxy-6-hydroxymethyldihydropteridine diphosphokinase [Sediminitomix flava]PWJ38486.1 2-amino-4-hydroxy-6-hydroxymethyldihydropteridine diphosphokinase [Sediminitomix flava]
MGKHKAFLSLGGNMGDRLQALQDASNELINRVGLILKSSSIYETDAWGVTDQPAFYNQVILVETELSPRELLSTILEIEKDLGRVRILKWGQRLIDIDILFYDNEIIEEEGLIVPHPYLHDRMFALAPLAEIDSQYVHPKIGKSLATLKSLCKDELEVRQLELAE